MKVLFTGFKGYNNTSKEIINKISNNKLLLSNSYESIDKEIEKIDIESYDLIIMLGLRSNLKKSIRIEINASSNDELLFTSLNYNKLKHYFNENNISCLINNKPTNYLCNYAYFNVLKRNKKAIFIHVPSLNNVIDLNKLISIISNVNISTCI